MTPADRRLARVAAGRRLWRRVLAGVLACLAPAAMAQPPSRPATVQVTVDDVHFRNYGVRDGLSQTSARAMLQDPTGALWIGTQDGLNRFDGYGFKVYRAQPQKPDSLPDSHVLALAPSQRGGFWVGTRSAGVARYNPERDAFNRYPADSDSVANGDAPSGVLALQEAPDGRLWVGHSGDGLFWLDPGDRRFQRLPTALARQLGTVSALALLDGRLLAGGKDGLWLVDPSGRTAQRWGRQGEDLRVDAIRVSPGQREVWVGTRHAGLFRFDENGRELGHWQHQQGLPHLSVRALEFDHQGRLWIASLEGLARMDAPGAPLKVWQYGAGLGDTLPSDRLQSLLVDRDGLVWVGSLLNGASVISPRSQVFKEVRIQSQPSRGSGGLAVGALRFDADGALWMGAAEGAGLVHYDFQRGVLAHFPPDPGNPRGLPSDVILDMRRDRLGRLWVGTLHGLARLDGDGFTVFQHVPGDAGSLPGSIVSAMTVDRQGNLWVGTAGGGLGKLCEGCSRFQNFGATPDEAGRAGLGSNAVDALFEDSHGALWVGLRGVGLARLDPATQRVEHFRARPSVDGYVGNDIISWISEDREGRLWVGHGTGVSWAPLRANGPLRFRNVTTPAVGGILQDDSGAMWLSTLVGITRLDPATGKMTDYGARDGAQSMGYFIAAADRFADGRIAFGGLNGVTLFDPAKVRATTQTYRVSLTELHLDRAVAADAHQAWAQWVRLGQGKGEIVLPPSGDDLALEFSAMSFADPQHLLYSYRLDGVDDDWVEVDAQRRLAHYNNLGPGRYTFRVRARDASGPWGPELVVPIRLTPPWWRTWGAYLAYVLLALLLVGGAMWEFHQRLSERKRAQREISESEQRLKLALWGTGDELWELDLVRGQLRRQNPLDTHVGVGEETVEGLPAIRDHVHPEDLHAYDEAVAAYVAGTHDSVEVSYRVLDPSGRWRWVLSRGRVVGRDASGRATRVLGTNSDITGLKEHEQALARVNFELEARVQMRTEALNSSNESLHQTIDELRDTQKQLVESEKMAALGGLVAGVAHEINTPLGVGVTAASYLEQQAGSFAAQVEEGRVDRPSLEAFTQVARESSRLILRNLQRADRMVKSFKQVAVDQSSEVTRMIELPAYLDEILLSLQPLLRQRRHEVLIDCPEPVRLETYPGAVYQVISNLVMNSVMHGFADREHGHIRIQVRHDEHDVLLHYEDDGCGMSEEARRRVFEPFFTTRRGSGGSGLGMHIVWNLVTQVLGGSISCSAAPVRGTAFDVHIPRQARPRREPA